MLESRVRIVDPRKKVVMRRALVIAGVVAAALGVSACAPLRSPAPTATSTRPISMAVLGDSLSRGYNACGEEYEDCPSVSWAGGSDPRVQSLAARLRTRTGRAVEVTNVAKTGVSADDLDRQVTSAVAARPDLITLDIGGNDACRPTLAEMTPTADFASEVDAALARIRTSAPHAVVLVASVLGPAALLRAGADDPAARAQWTRLGSCPTVLDHPQSDTAADRARRRAVADRIRSYDTALQTACARSERCVWDGGAFGRLRLATTDLSTIDFVHPSVAGLRRFAETEWSVLARSPRSAALLARAG